MRQSVSRSLFITASMALWSTTALAEASDDGAAKLQALFQTYLGSTEGVVQVAVDGDGYKVNFDAAPLISQTPAAGGMTVAVSPIEMTLIDNGDGTWDYAVDQPLSVAYEMAGKMKSATDYGQVLFTGTFDEALGDSSSYHLELNDMTSEQTQTDPGMGEITIKANQASMAADGTASAAETAGVDTEFSGTAGTMTYEVAMSGGEGAAPMGFTASVEKSEINGGMTGLRSQGLYGLLAFFVAHPDPALVEADKPALKTALQDALPLFENLHVVGSYSGIAVESPVGPVSLRELGMEIDVNGAVADGKFREAISLTGLSLPEGVVPPFAAPLVPSDLSLDVAASGFDLAAAAQLGLGMLELPAGTMPPADFEAQMMAAFLPAGTVDITIAPGETNAPAYRLTYEGAMTVGPNLPMPVGKARIGLTGMDNINQALTASPPELGLQGAAPMLGMAQMMAEQGVDGELVWNIESTATGGLSVNGQVMMGGGQ